MVTGISQFRPEPINEKPSNSALMIRLLGILLNLQLLLGSNMTLYAAPLPPVGPLTVRGTIEEITWYPEKKLKARITRHNGMQHNASGTLGMDRTFPAHYAILLVKTRVIPGKTAIANHAFADGAPVRIVINHPTNNGFLKKGMRITVYDYTEKGDEGGTWYSYLKLSIL